MAGLTRMAHRRCYRTNRNSGIARYRTYRVDRLGLRVKNLLWFLWFESTRPAVRGHFLRGAWGRPYL